MPEYTKHNSPRNLTGYGSRPPIPEWPGNALLALNFVINIGEESEHCLLNGDPTSENGRIEIAGRAEVIYRLLEFIEQFPDIWITTGKEIAQLWYRHYPLSL
jgi:hypothetical protein